MPTDIEQHDGLCRKVNSNMDKLNTRKQRGSGSTAPESYIGGLLDGANSSSPVGYLAALAKATECRISRLRTSIRRHRATAESGLDSFLWASMLSTDNHHNKDLNFHTRREPIFSDLPLVDYMHVAACRRVELHLHPEIDLSASVSNLLRANVSAKIYADRANSPITYRCG